MIREKLNKYLGHDDFKILDVNMKDSFTLDIFLKENKDLHPYYITMRSKNGYLQFATRPRGTNHLGK